MKQAGICLWMMIKRMGKHPVYWVLLLLFPAACFVVPKFNRAVDEERILVGYVFVGTENEKSGYAQKMCTGIENYVNQTELFNYKKYVNAEEMKKDILTGEISCGVAFDENFAERLMQQDYRHCITLYVPEGMNVDGLVQEDIFRKVYQVYSAVWYLELLEQYGYEISPEEVLQKFSEYQKEGKVFAVNYEVLPESGETLHSALKNESGETLHNAPEKEDRKTLHNASEKESGAGNSLLSLRGILAFLTLVSASLGALDSSKDRKKGLGKGISGSRVLAAAAVGAPILPSMLFQFIGILTENPDITEILPEFCRILVYGLVLWLFALLFSKVIPEKLLEGIMPCFLLLVLICCPIFFTIGETVPFIGYLSKLFPITWYLEF